MWRRSLYSMELSGLCPTLMFEALISFCFVSFHCLIQFESLCFNEFIFVVTNIIFVHLSFCFVFSVFMLLLLVICCFVFYRTVFVSFFVCYFFWKIIILKIFQSILIYVYLTVKSHKYKEICLRPPIWKIFSPLVSVFINIMAGFKSKFSS